METHCNDKIKQVETQCDDKIKQIETQCDDKVLSKLYNTINNYNTIPNVSDDNINTATYQLRINTDEYANDSLVYNMIFNPNQDGLDEQLDNTRKYYKFGQSTQIKVRQQSHDSNPIFLQSKVIKCFVYKTAQQMQLGEKRYKDILKDMNLLVVYYNKKEIYKVYNS